MDVAVVGRDLSKLPTINGSGGRTTSTSLSAYGNMLST